MAKKPITKAKATAKGKTTTRKRAPTVGTMKGGVVVGGNVNVKGDRVVGTQYKDLREQVAQIATPAEFIARAQEVQAQIAALKQQPELAPAQVRRLELVEADVKETVEEAQKENPVGQRINETLASAKETMDKISAGVKSAVGLGVVLGGLGQAALKLFGG